MRLQRMRMDIGAGLASSLRRCLSFVASLPVGIRNGVGRYARAHGCSRSPCRHELGSAPRGLSLAPLRVGSCHTRRVSRTGLSAALRESRRMMRAKLDRVCADARALLGPGPGKRYARECVSGVFLWSGADLKVSSPRWAMLSIQRRAARIALESAGGVVLSVDRGALRTAVYVGMTDYGDALYLTRMGTYQTGKGCNAVLT